MNLQEITASRLERLSLCPGSLKLERGLPERTNDLAMSGQKIHAALAAYYRGAVSGIQSLGLNEDEEEIAKAYIIEANQLIEPLVLPDLPNDRVLVEKRMTVGGFSGQPDLVVLRIASDVRQALVLDWKTGWLEQEHSQANLQLRAYAVLVGLTHQVSTVEVALLQRNAPTVLTRYETDDLVRAMDEIREIIRGANAPGAIRSAGERQCRYCRAIGICPEARATIPQVLAAVDPRLPSLPLDAEAETVDMLVQCLDGEQLAYIRERKKIAEMVFGFTDEEIKRRLKDDPDSVPGWALKPGARTRRVTDVQRAFELTEGLISANAFVSCCAVSVGLLEEAVRTTKGCTIAQSKQALAERLEPVIEEKQNQPSIVRAKA